MALNTISKSHVLTVPAPSPILSGQILIAGSLHGVAITNATTGELVAIHRDVVVELPKTAPTLVLSLGDPVEYDPATHKVVGTGGTQIGVCVMASPSGVPTVRVAVE